MLTHTRPKANVVQDVLLGGAALVLAEHRASVADLALVAPVLVALGGVPLIHHCLYTVCCKLTFTSSSRSPTNVCEPIRVAPAFFSSFVFPLNWARIFSRRIARGFWWFENLGCSGGGRPQLCKGVMGGDRHRSTPADYKRLVFKRLGRLRELAYVIEK